MFLYIYLPQQRVLEKLDKTFQCNIYFVFAGSNLCRFGHCRVNAEKEEATILHDGVGSRLSSIAHHHHHQVPDLEQTLATMPLQTSLSSDNFKKFKPLLCPPVAELQRLSRNVIRCLPLSRLPSTLPVKDKNSKPLRLHKCPKNSICLFLIVFNSDI